MDKLLLIDGNALAYRAFYATAYLKSGILTNSKKIPVNAVLTFANMIIRILKEECPTHILVAFDMGKETFRHAKFKDYKSKRKRMPEELVIQMPIIKEMLQSWKIQIFEQKMIEADDIIASAARKFKKNINIKIISNDRDLFQLISDNVSVLVSDSLSKSKTFKVIDINNFFKQFNYHPHQVPDIKGLAGDNSDNLPGVLGIGPKRAISLIQEFNSLENIYKNLDSIPESLRAKLIKSKETAFISKELAKLNLDINLDINLENLAILDLTPPDLQVFFKKYELFSLIKKLYSEKKLEKSKENTVQISMENSFLK